MEVIAVWMLEGYSDNDCDSATFVVGNPFSSDIFSHVFRRLFNQRIPWIEVERDFGKVNGTRLCKSN